MKSITTCILLLFKASACGQFLRSDFDAPLLDPLGSDLPTGDQAAAQRALGYWNAWLDTTGHTGHITFNVYQKPLALLTDCDGTTGYALAQALGGELEREGSVYLTPVQDEWRSGGLLHPTVKIQVHSGYIAADGQLRVPLANGSVNQYDLTSVIIHEIGHQLGMTSRPDFWGQQANTQWESFIEGKNSDGVFVRASSWSITTPPTEFRFTGPTAVAANDNTPVGIYWDANPTNPQCGSQPGDGSSVSHPALPSGSLYSMRYRAYPGVNLHGLHAVEVGMFRDLGWTIKEPVSATAKNVQPVMVDGEEVAPTWHFGGFWTDEFGTGIGGLPPTEQTHVRIREGAAMEIRELQAVASSVNLEGLSSEEPAKLVIKNGKSLTVGALVAIRDHSLVDVQNGDLVVTDQGQDYNAVNVYSGGTLRIQENSSVTSPRLNLQGGTFEHYGTATIDTLIWSSGSILTDRSVDVQDFQVPEGGDAYMESVTLNTFKATLAAGSRFSLQDSYLSVIPQGGDANAVSISLGATLHVDGTSVLNSPRLLLNGGQLEQFGEATVGTLVWSAGQITGTGATDVANLQIAAGSSVVLDSAILTGGHVQLEDNSGLRVLANGRLSNQGNLQIGASAHMEIGEDVPFTPRAGMEIGTGGSLHLKGSRAFANNGRMFMLPASNVTMDLGAFENHGGMEMGAGSELAKGVGPFENEGGIVMDSALISMAGGIFTNDGGLNLRNTASITATGTLNVVNNGGISKTGTGTAVIGGSVRNYGGITVEEGILKITGGGGNFGGGIRAESGATLSVSPNFELGEGITGHVMIEGRKTVSSILSVAGGMNLEVSDGVDVEANGVLKGTGSLVTTRVAISGTLAPGASPGVLTVAGDVEFSPSATLEFELGGPGSAEVDQLLITNGGDLTLDGTLVVIPYAGFGAGDYELIRFEGALFDNLLELAPIPGGFIGTLSYEPGSIHLLVTIPEPSGLVVFGALFFFGFRRRGPRAL